MSNKRSPGFIRVGHLVFSLDAGGMENGVVNLANHLPREGFRTSVFCLEQPGAFAKRLRSDVEVTSLGRHPGWDWGACLRLGRAWTKNRPDIIHTHNLGPLMYAVVARALHPASWRVPIVHGEHGALQGESLEPRRLRQRRFLYKFCRRVHAVSEGLRTELGARGMPTERLVSVLNGVDCDRFLPAKNRTVARVVAGLPEDAFVLGSVGRFIATKRHKLLIGAFERVADEHAKARLMLLGDGGEERTAVLECVGASRHRERIHVMGNQENPVPFYQAMDLMVMPSSHEGLANALLEAMASAVAVLAHSACGAAEVIDDGQTGLLRAMEDESGLGKVLLELVGQPSLLEWLGAAAREAAKQRFSLNAMVSNYADLYRDAYVG